MPLLPYLCGEEGRGVPELPISQSMSCPSSVWPPMSKRLPSKALTFHSGHQSSRNKAGECANVRWMMSDLLVGVTHFGVYQLATFTMQCILAAKRSTIFRL